MTTVIRCPVHECDWSLDTTPPPTPDGALADVFGWGVVSATHRAQALRDNELKAEAHLKSHSMVEWVATVNHWREALAKQVAAMVEMTEAFTAAAKR